MFHIAILGLAVYALRKPKASTRLYPIYFYLLFIIVFSLVGYLTLAPDQLYLNYIFCLVLCISLNSIFHDIDYRKTLNALQCASACIAIFSAINIYLNMDEVRMAQSAELTSGARPAINFLLYGGGINLEASWTALAAAFFLNERFKFIAFIFLSFFIDYCLLSRSGFMATSIILLLWAHQHFKLTGRNIVFFIMATIALLVILASTQAFLSNIVIFERFANIGNEPGSLGRLAMWHYVPDAFMANPFFGLGAGNAIRSIQLQGFTGTDGNVHNYLIHHLLEFGIPGLTLWLILSKRVICIKNKPELRAYFIVFFILSLIQFRGAEHVMYFVISILILAKKNNPLTSPCSNLYLERARAY
ncbi:O-Antigen ligase [compost metagenome]